VLVEEEEGRDAALSATNSTRFEVTNAVPLHGTNWISATIPASQQGPNERQSYVANKALRLESGVVEFNKA